MLLNYTLYLTGLKNKHKVPTHSIIEVLLTTFREQEQKSLGFRVFFMVLHWVTLKQMTVLVLDNLVIYGTNVWNRFDWGSLDSPLVHFCECFGKCV